MFNDIKLVGGNEVIQGVRNVHHLPSRHVKSKQPHAEVIVFHDIFLDNIAYRGIFRIRLKNQIVCDCWVAVMIFVLCLDLVKQIKLETISIFQMEYTSNLKNTTQLLLMKSKSEPLEYQHLKELQLDHLKLKLLKPMDNQTK